jgi:Fe-coproporphyrin III synthase
MSRVGALERNLYVLKNYVFSRQKRPFLASYKLTYRCNLHCQQCPFYTIQEEDPSYDAVIETLERLYERGNRAVIFEGGEPMLWLDGERTIHDVVAAAKRRFFVVGMTSNGTLPLDVPVDVQWVSLDGLEKTHNELRGGGDCFAKIIENIERSSHPSLFAHITINRMNSPEIPELIHYLSGLVKGITIQLYYPYDKKYDLYLDNPQREAVLDEIIQLKRAGLPLLNSVSALEALKINSWHCVDWLIDNANPDGSLSQGCYLKGRGLVECDKCGFSPHTEASLAYQGDLRAIRAGLDIFFG